MNCPACGFAVQVDFAFCPKCGGKLLSVRSTPSGDASSASPSAAAATGATGTRSDEGDRRLGTVLFPDLAGFTALAEALDPEEVRALPSDLFRELSGAIQRHGR